MERSNFSDQLAELSAGTVDAELTARLSELVKAVRITGAKGYVQLKIEVKPHPSNEDLAVIIPTIKDNIPSQGLSPEVVTIYHDGTMEPFNDSDEPRGNSL